MKVELSVKELTLLATAIRIDIVSDDSPPADKVALLDKLNNLIKKYN